jgi:hypothetical protein
VSDKRVYLLMFVLAAAIMLAFLLLDAMGARLNRWPFQIFTTLMGLGGIMFISALRYAEAYEDKPPSLF